jgi:hypothetical protein
MNDSTAIGVALDLPSGEVKDGDYISRIAKKPRAALAE